MYPLEQCEKILFNLGRHEEFTLYVLKALFDKNKEQKAFKLAKEVNGWGGVFAVRLFAHTEKEEIKQWMTYGGYENTISLNYTAYSCLSTGYLIQQLRQSKIDPELLEHADILIKAAIQRYEELAPEVIEGILDLSDAPELLELYLRHKEKEPITEESIEQISYVFLNKFLNNLKIMLQVFGM